MQNAIRAGNTSELLPVLAYYGTGRFWQMEKLTQTKLQATSRSMAYSNCLDSGSSYKTFAEWFRYWNIAAIEQRYNRLSSHLLNRSRPKIFRASTFSARMIYLNTFVCQK
jgi:predicted ATP-binding protein involved in virulence